jgi:hypothetical protein
MRVKRSAMPRKAAKKRTTKTPRCSKQRCGKPALHDNLCKKHITEACDQMARALKRQEVTACSRCGSENALQWSHHLSRRFMGIRWHKLNSTMHCAPCHTVLTHNPFMHVEWIQQHVGMETYSMLYSWAYGPGAIHFGTADLERWYEQLKREVA